MKTKNFKTKFIVAACLGFFFCAFGTVNAQEGFKEESSEPINVEQPVYIPPSLVTVSGTVVQNRGPLMDAQVTVYKNNEMIDKFKTFKSGFFKLNLEVNNDYLIAFSKKGSVTKKIQISTHNVPENMTIIREGLFIDMFEIAEGVEPIEIDEPVGRFYYSERSNNLEYDKSYTKKINAKLARMKHK